MYTGMVRKPSSMKLPTFTIDTSRVQSGLRSQDSQSDRTPFSESDNLNLPTGSKMSTLAVPSSASLRRPSTADIVIQKLRVERLEGGGLSVSGVALAANCHITLIIFGAFFLLAGLVLSYIGYADQSQETVIAQAAGAPHGIFKKAGTHRQMQVVGPVFLIVGLLMLIIGFTMYGIGRKIRQDEKCNRATVSAMQIRELENSFCQARNINNCSPIHTFSPQINDTQAILSVRRGSWWIEPAPVELPDMTSYRDQPPPYSQASRSASPNQENNDMSGSPPQYHSQPKIFSESPVGVQISYPLHTDVTSSFPDAFGVASFPIKFDQTLDLAGRRHSTTSCNSSPCTSPTNIFEVQECPESGETNKQIITDESQSSKECGDIAKANESEFEERIDLKLPQIQVTKPSLETLANVSTAVSIVDNNLPLNKNGVDLPRLSRHSISSHGDIST